MIRRTTKPPLGVMPRFVADERRLEELKEAMMRFISANWPINVEWLTEYNEIIERYTKDEREQEQDNADS